MQTSQLVNNKYRDVFLKKPRYIILMGGRAAGRSTVASQFALAKLRAPEYFRCAIMRLVLGDIRNSIYQDIYDRIEEHGLEESISVKEHLLTFEYGNNKINGIGFRKSSGDQKSKLKSLANYNCVIIEEADEINEEDFMQLDDSLRTMKSDITIMMMLNPPHKNHWIIKRWFNLVESDREGFYRPELKQSYTDTLFIHSTFRDNVRNLNETTISNFENYKDIRPDHYYNMIEGLVSEGSRGRIFKNWTPTTTAVYEQLPFQEIYGLDFGFTNDPAALIGIKQHNDKVWLREMIYETGLLNKQLSKRMEELGIPKSAIIYADSSEPKSIEELRGYGWDVRPADKGPDSVTAGINMLLEKEVFYTEDSENIATEVQEYKWAMDRNKEPTNDPVDKFNHAMDGTRYGIWTHSRQMFVGFV